MNAVEQVIASGACEVTYKGEPAVLVGLYVDDYGDTQAVIRLEGHGLYLKVVHPSKVQSR
jgi:hypothetical protein